MQVLKIPEAQKTKGAEEKRVALLIASGTT